MKTNIMPECYVDTNLIEYLIGDTVGHQHCCSKVVGTMKRVFADRFAVGIIDDDKVEMGYVSECELIAQTHHLKLMKHKEKPHYIILVNPAIDGFVMDCAKEMGLNIKEYNLPGNFNAFKKRAKSTTSARDKDFRQLFVALRNHHEVACLAFVLKYLDTAQYSADTEKLKGIFLILDRPKIRR